MKTVIIVDDSTFMRNQIKQIIEPYHFRVMGEAKDGKEAIDVYKVYKPDITLLDLVMPSMDGLTALREIIKINPDAKVIVFSSLATNYTMIEALQAGATDFIVKPYFKKLIPALEKMEPSY